jgi:8-oxo-dGTP pyrophosphatase MutT (NUDIX family)
VGAPGGAKEHGEHPEEAAARELREETGLVPTTPLELIAVAPLTRIYGMDWLHCFYACECAEGEVVINEEHSAYRWVDPVEYGRRSYGEEVVEMLKDRPVDLANLNAFRNAFGRYLAWRIHRQTCTASG